MRWFYAFAVACIGLVAIGLGLAWVLGGFSDLGLSGHGVFAVVLTVVFTVLVAVGLMGLVFYSSRSGHDIQAHQEDEANRTGLAGCDDQRH